MSDNLSHNLFRVELSHSWNTCCVLMCAGGILMKLNMQWHKPRFLKVSKTLIYDCDNFENIPSSGGIYCFARQHGSNIAPLYIGKASNLQSRIKQQLNSVKLMKGIKNAGNGKRVLIIGEFIAGRGQQQPVCLGILERAFIKQALSEGHDLLNIQGTKMKYHRICSKGTSVFPRTINVEMK